MHIIGDEFYFVASPVAWHRVSLPVWMRIWIQWLCVAGSTRRHARKTPRVEERFSGGVQYPYDLWCLLGDYISPESVGTFAAICRSSHTVVHSARFWTKLYHRSVTSTTPPHKTVPETPFTQDAQADLRANLCANPLMLLATCVSTPIYCSVYLHARVARCSASCVNGA